MEESCAPGKLHVVQPKEISARRANVYPYHVRLEDREDGQKLICPSVLSALHLMQALESIRLMCGLLLGVAFNSEVDCAKDERRLGSGGA